MDIKTFTKPDGTIRFATSPCCCPPNAVRVKGSIHTRGMTWWYQIETPPAVEDGPPGISGWVSCELDTPLVIGAADTVEQFLEVMQS